MRVALDCNCFNCGGGREGVRVVYLIPYIIRILAIFIHR